MYENKGIYYTTPAYGDYHYVVDFDKPDIDKQFYKFILMVETNGAKRVVKEKLSGLRELLT